MASMRVCKKCYLNNGWLWQVPVFCCLPRKKVFVVEKGTSPPKGCPYLFEHGIAESVNIDKASGED